MWRVAAIAVLLLVVFPSLAQERKPSRFRKVLPDLSLKPLAPEDDGRLRILGATTFTTEQLREPLADSMREIREQGLTKPRADDAAYFLAIHYRKAGFPDVEVNYEIRGQRLVLRVAEGRRTYLRRVAFNGNASITDSILYDYMIGGTEERLLENPTAVPFVEADVKTGVARLRGLYESEGFLDAVIDEPAITLSADRTRADVTVTIVEGQRYVFGDLVFLGNTIFAREELIQVTTGDRFRAPYTTQQVNAMQRDLEFFYKARGYYQAKVEVASDPKQAVNGRVPVTFTVTPHQLFRFNGVTVRGLDRLRPGFLPQRFAKLKGEVYSPAKLDEVYREMLRTGLFKNLRYEAVPQPDNTLRLDLTIEEAKAKELGFSIGAGSYEGFLLGFRASDRNLYGTGRPLALDIDVTSRGARGELLYVDPWLFESAYTLRAKAYASGREEEGYSKRETGIRAELSRKLTKNLDLAVFLQLENVEITEALIEPQFLGATAYQIGTLGFTQTFDFRDHPVNVTRGWIVNTSIDFDAIAGELAFARGTARWSYYMPIRRRMLLALGARGGLIFPLTGVPIDERYFNGGGTTVRSFDERELGPKDKQGYPIGGQAFTVFNAELTFPIKGALQGAAFVDAGNVVSAFEDAGLDDMRFGVGLGLRYKLPIGPLRLDFGVNPAPKLDEKLGAFHFSFGFAF